jgi:ribonuclease P protein component
MNQMAKSFTLGKNERLKRRKVIEQLFRDGKAVTLFPLRVQYLVVSHLTDPLQAGFSVSSRHFKKAVHRNRIKRLMREAYRLQKKSLQETMQEKPQQMALFFIYTGKELPDSEMVNERIALLLKKLLRIAHEIPAAHT